jgi:tetratricopeptide (TPR) repeat protein
LIPGCSNDEASAPTPEPVEQSPPTSSTPEPRVVSPSNEAPTVDSVELAAARSRYARNLEKGRVLTRKGNHEQAIARYREALVADPNDVTVLGELGWAAFLSGDHTLAERTTRHALRHAGTAKQEGMLLYNLGRVAEAQGRGDDAVGFYRQSLRKRPDNATVQARLESLEPALTPAVVASGMPAIARELPDLEGVCTSLRERSCADFVVLEGDAACTCEPALVQPSVPPGEKAALQAGLIRLSVGEMAMHEVWFAVVRDREGWTVLDPGVWAYNPGAMGIFEEVEATRNELRQLIPSGPHEWAVTIDKHRTDRDMGLNEIETETHRWSFACAVVRGQARCTMPIEEHFELVREVEFPDEAEDDVEHDPDLPRRTRYDADLEFRADATVTLRVTKDTDRGGPQGRAGGRRLPAGTRPLLELLGGDRERVIPAVPAEPVSVAAPSTEG